MSTERAFIAFLVCFTVVACGCVMALLFVTPRTDPSPVPAYRSELELKMKPKGYAPVTIVIHQCPASQDCEPGDRLWIEGRTAGADCYSIHASIKTGLEGREVKIFPCKK